jgi:hypothetical protein
VREYGRTDRLPIGVKVRTDELMMSSVRTGLRSGSSTVMRRVARRSIPVVQNLERTLSLRLSRWFMVYLISTYLDAYGSPR